MNKKLNIAFDLDGVLVDLPTAMIEDLMELTGKNLEYHEKFNLGEVVGQENIDKVLYRLYHSYDLIPIMDEARYVLNYLWMKTEQPITIVTARSIDYATETHKLVKRVFKDIPYILIFCGGHSNKHTYLHDFDYFVEDRRRTAIELAKKGKTVFLIDTNYNRDIKGKFPWGKRIIRIKDLNELMDYKHLFFTEV